MKSPVAPSLAASTAVPFTFGQILRAARAAHDEFRLQADLQARLGWKGRKVWDLENDRIRPSATELAQLIEVLPLLHVLLVRLDPVQPLAPRGVEMAGRL